MQSPRFNLASSRRSSCSVFVTACLLMLTGGMMLIPTALSIGSAAYGNVMTNRCSAAQDSRVHAAL